MISEKHSAAARRNILLAKRNQSLSDNGRWAGGAYVAADGYVYVRVACENGRTRYRLEHRIVMEQVLGRTLERLENVHHKNGNRRDNRPENLEVLSVAEHARRHPESMDKALAALGRKRKPLRVGG